MDEKWIQQQASAVTAMRDRLSQTNELLLHTSKVIESEGPRIWIQFASLIREYVDAFNLALKGNDEPSIALSEDVPGHSVLMRTLRHPIIEVQCSLNLLGRGIDIATKRTIASYAKPTHEFQRFNIVVGAPEGKVFLADFDSGGGSADADRLAKRILEPLFQSVI
jgi:hypothetical protein